LHVAKSHAEAAAAIRIVRSGKPVCADGSLAEWDWKTAAAIGPREGRPRAEVAMRTDGKTFAVAFKVVKPGAFLNTGTDDVTRLFLTGDAVDIQYNAHPAADPARKVPILGDCRLVLSKLAGNPVAVLYQARVPNAKHPVSFRSPTRSVTFDAVSRVADAQVAIVDTADGYIVEAVVPLRVMGGQPRGAYPGLWPGRIIQGDAGIIVADKAGRRVARIYRFNRQTQIVNDVPTEAALVPSRWGEFEVDR